VHFLLEARKEPYFSKVTGVAAAEIGKKDFSFFPTRAARKETKPMYYRGNMCRSQRTGSPRNLFRGVKRRQAVRPALLDGRLAGAEVVNFKA